MSTALSKQIAADIGEPENLIRTGLHCCIDGSERLNRTFTSSSSSSPSGAQEAEQGAIVSIPVDEVDIYGGGSEEAA